LLRLQPWQPRAQPALLLPLLRLLLLLLSLCLQLLHLQYLRHRQDAATGRVDRLPRRLLRPAVPRACAGVPGADAAPALHNDAGQGDAVVWRQSHMIAAAGCL
jgi:hypothetical protein